LRVTASILQSDHGPKRAHDEYHKSLQKVLEGIRST